MTATYKYRDENGERRTAEVTVGLPVTLGIGSDCYGYEVIEVRNDHEVVIRKTKPVEMSDWTDGCSTYKYESCPNGPTRVLSDRGTHGWHVKGDYRSPSYGWCYRVSFGFARHYRDPTF